MVLVKLSPPSAGSGLFAPTVVLSPLLCQWAVTCESDQLCGESPQLGFVIPFGNNKEREHPNWALRVDRAWLQGNSPSTEIALGDWSCTAKMVCAGGSVPAGRGRIAPAAEKWGLGRREWWADRYECARQVNLAGFVTTPVFLAEPTWIWKWISHRTRSRSTQTVSSYTSTAQSKSWGDSFSFRTSWIL